MGAIRGLKKVHADLLDIETGESHLRRQVPFSLSFHGVVEKGDCSARNVRQRRVSMSVTTPRQLDKMVSCYGSRYHTITTITMKAGSG